MDEALIRGVLQGVVFGAVGLVAYVAWKIIRSQSEVARRIKIVAGVAFAAFLIAVFIAGRTGDRIGMLLIAAVIVAIVWVFKGRKKDQ